MVGAAEAHIEDNAMNDDEISTINRKLAEWAGVKAVHVCKALVADSERECECPCDGCIERGEFYPDYFRTNASQDLLGVLVKKEHSPHLYHSVDADGFAAWYCNIDPGEIYHVRQDISEAICHACLGVAEREGKMNVDIDWRKCKCGWRGTPRDAIPEGRRIVGMKREGKHENSNRC